MESNEFGGILYAALVIGLIISSIFCVGYAHGVKQTTRDMQREAVKAGVAHYEPDEDGGSKFTYGVQNAK